MPPQTEPKRAIIYARQSKDSEDGIDRQVEKSLKLISDRGLELVHAPFTDNEVSATNRRKRPAYELAMGMVKANRCDVLVVAHMDRLYRRAAELETIIPIVEKTGVLVVSTDGAYDLSTANGRMVARMLCAASQGEVETKARRNRDANVQAAKNGQRNKSGCRPFGYCADRFTPMDAGVSLDLVHGADCPSMDGPGWPSTQPWQEVTVRVPDTVYDADGRVVTTQSEADAIRDGIASVNRGGSITGIERKWHALGLRPPLRPHGPLPDGNPWNHHTVKRILTNPHVAGWRSYRNGEIVAAGNWPAIVGPVEWETAQAILTDPGRARPAGAVSLLGGIAECRCGATIGHAQKKAYGGYGRYRCTAYKQGKAAATGPHVVVKKDLIDRYITDVLLETMEQPDTVDLFADDSGQVDIPALKEKLAALDKALAKLSLQNSMDLIPDRIFMQNAAEISAERETVTAQIAEAGQVNAAAVLITSADVRATWEAMDISERRAVVRSVMRVTLKPPGCGCRNPDLDQLVRIAWKTPQRA
jgi:site-specific DNA recombinase